MAKGNVDLFRKSSLGQFQSSMSRYQQLSSQESTEVSHSTASWFRLDWSRGSANQPESLEAARSLWNIPSSSLVCFSLWSHDKRWSVKKARWTNATVMFIVCWVIVIPSPNIRCSVKHPLQQNITGPLSRKLPERLHRSVLSKPSSLPYLPQQKHPLILHGSDGPLWILKNSHMVYIQSAGKTLLYIKWNMSLTLC